MEITGKIIASLPEQGGVSQRTGNSWKSQDFVIETHDTYPKRCVFRVFGADRLQQFNIQVVEELTVSFDIDAHEYNGRWYNDIRAWNVQRVAVADENQPPLTDPFVNPSQPPQPAPIPAPQPAVEDTSADDLPF